MSPVFEWDNRKANANFRKHRVRFGIIVGRSTAKHVLLVCYTEPVMDHIRIIGARRATKAEQRDYEEHLKA